MSQVSLQDNSWKHARILVELSRAPECITSGNLCKIPKRISSELQKLEFREKSLQYFGSDFSKIQRGIPSNPEGTSPRLWKEYLLSSNVFQNLSSIVEQTSLGLRQESSRVVEELFQDSDEHFSRKQWKISLGSNLNEIVPKNSPGFRQESRKDSKRLFVKIFPRILNNHLQDTLPEHYKKSLQNYWGNLFIISKVISKKNQRGISPAIQKEALYHCGKHLS